MEVEGGGEGYSTVGKGLFGEANGTDGKGACELDDDDGGISWAKQLVGRRGVWFDRELIRAVLWLVVE